MGERDVILVVDDQKAVLEVTASMLRRSGYEVLEASGGQDALRTLESRPEVTVLLTDCNMPVLRGKSLPGPSCCVGLTSGSSPCQGNPGPTRCRPRLRSSQSRSRLRLSSR